MRLAFLGTPDFAATTLAALIAAGHEVVCVYTQPPRPAGRGQKLVASPVADLATSHGIAVRTPASLRDPVEHEAFRALALDVAVVAAYGLILPAAILDAPRHGCLNVHGSLLPRWRGAAPIQRAIMAGDTQTGVAIMQMERGLDTGPTLLVEAVPITATTTGGSLTDELAALGARLMVSALGQLLTLAPIPQPSEGVTYAEKITATDRRLDWTKPAAVLERQIRAMAPRPGVQIELNGEAIRVLAADVVAGAGRPGSVLDRDFTIATGDGALRPRMLQRPGRGVVEARAFLNGVAVTPGMIIDGSPGGN